MLLGMRLLCPWDMVLLGQSSGKWARQGSKGCLEMILGAIDKHSHNGDEGAVSVKLAFVREERGEGLLMRMLGELQ